MALSKRTRSATDSYARGGEMCAKQAQQASSSEEKAGWLLVGTALLGLGALHQLNRANQSGSASENRR